MAAPPLLPDTMGLVLVGYRASGKTTVGRLLAERLGRDFYDVDMEIEREQGRSIAELFEAEGELAFRDLEEAFLRHLCRDHRGAVLATGGGAILREANRREIADFGVVLWLSAPAQILVDRLRNDPLQRPALTAAGLFEEVPEILRSREPWYRDVSDLIVDASSASPSDVANDIVSRLESPGFRMKDRR